VPAGRLLLAALTVWLASLLVFVALLYGLAFLFGRSHLRGSLPTRG